MGEEVKNRKNIKWVFFIAASMIILLAGMALSSAQTFYQPYQQNVFSSAQYYQPSFQQYYSQQGVVDYKTLWPILSDASKCESNQDFLVQIRPAGCQPAVVRSDLLEEQNVPVFCKMDAIKLNPLIDVASLKSVSFKGGYPKEIAGISFHPSLAALRMYTKVLDSPLLNDAGYAVIVLKKQENEKTMPNNIAVNLTAVLKYDMENVFGAGKTSFYLKDLKQEEWEADYKKYGFWRGKGYLRAEWVEQDSAGITIYSDKDRVLRKLTLKKGQTSDLVYIPGFYCSGGIQVKLNEVSSGKARVLIKTDENSFWLSEGERFLDSNCYVRKIIGYGSGAGKAVLNCRGSELELGVGLASSVFIKENGKEKIEVRLGEGIPGSGIYIAYIGDYMMKHNGGEMMKHDFAVFVSDVSNSYITLGKISDEKLGEIYSSFGQWAGEYKGGWKGNVEGKIKNVLGVGDESNVKVVLVGDGYPPANGDEYTLVEKAGLKDATLTRDIKTNFENAEKTTKELVESYGSEKTETDEFYSAIALYELAELAGKINKLETQQKLLKQVVEKYPSSSLAREAENKLEELGNYNYEKASSLMTIDGKTYYIKLEQVEKPSAFENGAVFDVSEGAEKKEVGIQIGESIYHTEGNSVYGYITLLNIDSDKILVDYKHKNLQAQGSGFITERRELRRGESLILENNDGTKKTATLKNINIRRVAEVEIISKIPSGTSEANFTVRIGIEKRAIKLSPDKALEKIENINKSIERFEGITKKLGNVITGLKAGCFMTSAGLIIKNLFTNIGGRSLARQNVMDGYWKSKCAGEVNEAAASGKKITMTQCYSKYNDEIEKSVDNMQKGMETLNNEIDKSRVSKGGIFGRQIDNAASTKKFSEEFIRFKDANSNMKVNIAGSDKTFGELSDKDINNMVENGELSTAGMRDIMLYGRLYNSGNVYEKAMSQNMLNAKLEPVFEFKEIAGTRASYGAALQNSVPGGVINSLGVKPGTREEPVNTWPVGENKIEGVPEGKYTIIHVPDGRVIAVPVDNIVNGKLKLDEKKNAYVLDVDNSKLDGSKEKLKVKSNGAGKISVSEVRTIMNQQRISNFVEINQELCRNRYLNPEVRFFETEPQKGFPAVVPVDTAKGWYAATKQVIPGFGIKSFTQSGAVSSFYLCNVGKNGREEWDSSVKDDRPCIQINLDTGQAIDQLSCLDAGEARRLVLKAKNVLEEAASQYKSGSRGFITLASGRFPVKAALKTTGLECQNFMSADDCNLLFNVCDPVICPPSRCDFGGRFPVDDVIQSGIIGSILLCLPNAGLPTEGGVLIPVCLSGIHAGLDAYVSILKSMRTCLQESVNSGKTIGICDEIYSIYLCEFFWRQAAPLIDVAVPKLIEYAYTGGRTQGGGEYLTVQNAWDTSQKSVKYFTDYYGVNAFNAFKIRSSAEIGSEVCKAFVGTKYPNKIDNLLKPESPVQFYARFDEILFSEASVPSTSQYKVYYHIFAGKDSGHYYSVYLKNPPETSYYASTPYIVVDSGYVGVGSEIDQAKDFTAPAGYKELCVRIDTKEECGFKQVTTSFAMDELANLYNKEQASETITSEKDCVAGTPSLYPLASPSLQGGAEEAGMPAIYKRGIIRICASDDPGAKADLGRWKAVGYCDESNKIKCWLDTNSVKNAITDAGLEKEALAEAEKSMNILEGKNNIFDETITSEKLDEARKLVESFEKGEMGVNTDDLLVKLREIEERGFFNSQKAKAFYLEFRVYKKLVENLVAGKMRKKSAETEVKTEPVYEYAETNFGCSELEEIDRESCYACVGEEKTIGIKKKWCIKQKICKLATENCVEESQKSYNIKSIVFFKKVDTKLEQVMGAITTDDDLVLQVSHDCDKIKLRKQEQNLPKTEIFGFSLDKKNEQFDIGKLEKGGRVYLFEIECIDNEGTIKIGEKQKITPITSSSGNVPAS